MAGNFDHAKTPKKQLILFMLPFLSIICNFDVLHRVDLDMLKISHLRTLSLYPKSNYH